MIFGCLFHSLQHVLARLLLGRADEREERSKSAAIVISNAFGLQLLQRRHVDFAAAHGHFKARQRVCLLVQLFIKRRTQQNLGKLGGSYTKRSHVAKEPTCVIVTKEDAAPLNEFRFSEFVKSCMVDLLKIFQRLFLLQKQFLFEFLDAGA